MRTPRKVIEYARSLGVEERCLELGPDGACQKCQDVMRRAMDHFYGHLMFGPQIAAAMFHDLQIQNMEDGYYD